MGGWDENGGTRKPQKTRKRDREGNVVSFVAGIANSAMGLTMHACSVGGASLQESCVLFTRRAVRTTETERELRDSHNLFLFFRLCVLEKFQLA